jgi:sirohydrochlorin cobaltochelatase
MSKRDDEYNIFEARLQILLPEEYRDRYEDVQPVSMGSTGLKFGSDGRVAWDEMWASFCDLAMAGGPPHRGALLEPGLKAEIDAEPGRYRQVVAEICRGVEMVTELAAEPSATVGWIDVDCPSTTMAGWLVRAINMENVSGHCDGMVLHLPASPSFRLEKEIKNVVTAIAKTSHYWLGHTSIAQHRAIANLFEVMESESPLIQSPLGSEDTRGDAFERLRDKVANEIYSATGLQALGRKYHGWLGVNCRSVPSAIQMMRAMVVSNVLCRREGDSIYVPINLSTDRSSIRIVELIRRAFSVFMEEAITPESSAADRLS